MSQKERRHSRRSSRDHAADDSAKDDASGARRPSSRTAHAGRRRPSGAASPHTSGRRPCTDVDAADDLHGARRPSSSAAHAATSLESHEEQEVDRLIDVELSRKLSFIDISINEIKAAILAEEPEWKVSDLLWHHLLMLEPDNDFRLLQNRPLHFWLNVYNKWQELGKWNHEKVPESVDANELRDVLGIELLVLRPIIKLFDPHGFRRIKFEGISQGTLAKVKVNMYELMTAGVMLSRFISTKHKLRFVFGLADIDDDRCLDEVQFAHFASAFINGVACAFGLGENKDILPSEKMIAIKARRLYARIGSIAAQRLQELHRAGSPSAKTRLKNLIIERQRTLMEQPERQSNSRKAPAGAVRQVLKYETVQQWCFRDFQDPLALPYALTIERFRSERYGDVADEYDESLSDFHLSHTAPMHLGEEHSTDDNDVLDREEVLQARQLYEVAKEASLDPFHLSPYALSERTGIDVFSSPSFCSKITRALEEAAEISNRGKSVDFSSFLQFMCPKALLKQINMMVAWCKQHDEILELERLIAKLKDFQSLYLANSEKPPLPLEDVASLEATFKWMDSRGKGYLTADDLIRAWEWDEQTAQETMARFEIRTSGEIDMIEFVRMMCPDDYRLPEMAGYHREVFGQVLEAVLAHKKRELRIKGRGAGTHLHAKTDMPVSAMPEVEASEWNRWNAVFDELDNNRDNMVCAADLEYAGLLSDEVSEFMMTVIDPDMPSAFTRRGFLSSLLQASGRRRKGFISSL